MISVPHEKFLVKKTGEMKMWYKWDTFMLMLNPERVLKWPFMILAKCQKCPK